MLNEEKIRLMTRMARYEQGEGREDLRIHQYFRRDYIGKALLKNFLWTTLGYLLILIGYFGYHMEFYLDNITKMSLLPLIMRIVLGYIVIMVVYSIIVYVIQSVKYVNAKHGVEGYTEEMNRLIKLYRREEKKNAASGPGRKSI